MEQKFIVRNKLYNVLKEKGITKKELAEMVGMHPQSFSRYDGQSNFRLENIAAMMVALNCSFDDLFEIIKY